MASSRQWIPQRSYRFHSHPDVHPVQLFLLDNGLRIVVHEDHRAPVFAYHTWFSVGSRHERPGRTGMAHLFEHLMFKETANLAPGEFDRLMERAGAQTNAATWTDWTFYYEKLPARHLELPFRLEADRMANMRLGSAQLEAEREVVLNERRMRVDNDPDGVLYETLYALAFGRQHPYGWPTIGWEEDIRAIALEDCHAFYRTYYAPNNAVLVVCGDVQTDAVLDLVDEHYGPLEPQPIPDAPPTPPVPAGHRHAELELELASERAIVAFVAPALGDPRYAAHEALVEILFNSDSARLTRELVLDEELASDASAWIAGFRYPGLVHLDAQAHTDVAAERLVERMLAAVERMAAEGPTEAERAKAATKMETDAVRERLSAGSIAHGLGMFEVTTNRFEDFFEAADRVRQVTGDEIRQAAQDWLDGPRTVVIGRPAPDPEESDPEECGGDDADGDDADPNETDPAVSP